MYEPYVSLFTETHFRYSEKSCLLLVYPRLSHIICRVKNTLPTNCCSFHALTSTFANLRLNSITDGVSVITSSNWIVCKKYTDMLSGNTSLLQYSFTQDRKSVV